MKGPSLQKTAALSAGLHLTFFLLSFLILRQSHDMIMPSPYTVSLVGPAGETRKKGAAAEPGEPLPAKKNQTTTHVDDKKETKSIEESIAALRAKKQAEEKLRQIVRLRSLVAIQGKGGLASSKSPTQGTASGAAIGPGEAGYIDKIRSQIQKQWRVPDNFKNKDLETIVSVRIGRDGTLTVEGFEKKSGNRVYDKYVLETIQKASPVARPMYEMEIGMRFSPKD